MRTALPDRVRLGVYEVDLRVGELRGGERSIILPEQALRVLRMLVERDGEMVEREEIRRTLWPNDTVVEFDHSINTAIRNLRRALGESPDNPKYIQTIPRRGYRLLVPVDRLEKPKDEASDSHDPRNSTQERQVDVAPRTHESASGNLIGKKVSHYRVLEVLGGGGMGMLYKAEDLKLGRQVALKFLPEDLAWDTLALRRFEREARTASSLDHPNICTIYEVEEHEQQPFIVMQLLRGETLRDRLNRFADEQKKLHVDELLEIATQISSGLQAAHAKGIIHRDIKPANIFLTSSDQVKILDFGLAKLVTTTNENESDGLHMQPGETTAASPKRARSVPVDTTLTRVGVAIGTAGYMSPEQVRGEQLDVRTDIFSFGLVLYEMATGQRAFKGDTAAIVHNSILNDAPAPVRQLSPEVPPGFTTIINKALEKDRERRYPTAEELRSELESLKGQGSLPTATVWAATKPKKRSVVWAVIAIVGAVAIIAMFGIGIRRMLSRPRLTERQLTFNPPGNRVTAGAISPDGKYLAYHDQTGLYLRNMASGDTHLVGLPASSPRGAVFDLHWFSGGQKLLAEVNGADGFDLWVLAASGQEEPRLLYRHARQPAISPDSQKIAFVTYNFGSSQNEVSVGDLSGDPPRKVVVSDEGGAITLRACGVGVFRA